MKSILLIDDKQEHLDLISDLLDPLGHLIYMANDGIQGLARFNEVSPELIICDIYMPGKDGIELISDLRRINPNIKIISMSGGQVHNRADMLKTARLLGVNKTFEKPFNLELFYSCVEDLLSDELSTKN